MKALPVRGPGVRALGLPLPPARMPLVHRGRPLKRWRYVGLFGPELMLCVGAARIGPLARRFWAVATPDGSLRERASAARGGVRLGPGRVSVSAPGVRVDLALAETGGVEVASPSGAGFAWTRKQAGVPAHGSVALDGRELPVDGEAFVDDSAGYHARRVSWRWSAGLGRSTGGERVGWNLVTGIHDSATDSERTLWIDGDAREVGPVRFADDLSCVLFSDGGELGFSEWCAREDHADLWLLRTDLRQPFGSFRGELPGGLRLAEGYGVMERHEVLW